MRVITEVLAIAAASAAPAPETVSVPAFDAVQLRGGGEVIVRHGPVQQVRLISGSSQVSRLRVERAGQGSKLVISACERRCPNAYKLRVEIVTPQLAAVAIDGGGTIAARGAFPQQRALGLAIHGGGLIDARPLRAASVGATINGGGQISTHAVQSLGATINGGGSVRYWGDPTTAVKINGGGRVTRGS